MRDVIRLLPVILGAFLLAGCDSTEDDSDTLRFNGTWRIVEAGSQTTDFSALVLSRYDDVLITFVADEDRFTMLLDVSGSPDDEIFSGDFSVDSDDREIDLFSSGFPGAFDFDYNFVNSDSVVLTSDDDEPILETLFGVDLEVDEIILVIERA
jgi:hypothetical protein